MQEHEIFYTPYTKDEILTALQRALGDLTDAQVLALVRNEAAERETHEEIFSNAIGNLHVALSEETNARVDADRMLQNAIVRMLDSGAKNEIDVSAVQGQQINGITWTVDADSGTVTANGTATADSFFFLWPRNTDRVFSDTTVLSGAPAGGSMTTHELQAQVGSTAYRDFGSTVNVPAGTIRYITCCVRNGCTVADLTFRPMLCEASKWAVSQDYAPFCPSLLTVYRMIRSMMNTEQRMQPMRNEHADAESMLHEETEAENA